MKEAMQLQEIAEQIALDPLTSTECSIHRSHSRTDSTFQVGPTRETFKTREDIVDHSGGAMREQSDGLTNLLIGDRAQTCKGYLGSANISTWHEHAIFCK
jgi:hypothetical protein